MLGVVHGPRHIFIRLESVESSNLWRYTKAEGGRLSGQRARLFQWHIVIAIAYCHGSGVAHRDMNPESIVVDDGGQRVKSEKQSCSLAR